MGPFVIIVTASDDEEFETQVVAPPMGFNRKEQAVRYIEENFANRKEPYLGCQFEIVAMRTLASFIQFCSWED